MYQGRIGLQADDHLSNTCALFKCKSTFDNLVIQLHVIHKHAFFIELNATRRNTCTHTNTTNFPSL